MTILNNGRRLEKFVFSHKFNYKAVRVIWDYSKNTTTSLRCSINKKTGERSLHVKCGMSPGNPNVLGHIVPILLDAIADMEGGPEDSEEMLPKDSSFLDTDTDISYEVREYMASVARKNHPKLSLVPKK